eukprot:CAMPEP_0206247692 /NCGR_PEP_ID=MMETSP0047_2-20121206/19955_1 /ASSEMBLY_ACC=CAM_ASM_000192 /TAXON_ID=195065 /ORGANISM="Chroomonas mesostigmatica_cf, Strain CCMP1168" /LENGTH=185 /DNA_ID=CAMNT_0053673253 /DNA_START=28 /DNA_END=581 /DNA_ORIENTATION=-
MRHAGTPPSSATHFGSGKVATKRNMRVDRHSGQELTLASRNQLKKGGRGGANWGRPGDELVEDVLSSADPAYDSCGTRPRPTPPHRLRTARWLRPGRPAAVPGGAQTRVGCKRALPPFVHVCSLAPWRHRRPPGRSPDLVPGLTHGGGACGAVPVGRGGSYVQNLHPGPSVVCHPPHTPVTSPVA